MPGGAEQRGTAGGGPARNPHVDTEQAAQQRKIEKTNAGQSRRARVYSSLRMSTPRGARRLTDSRERECQTLQQPAKKGKKGVNRWNIWREKRGEIRAGTFNGG